MKKTAIILTFLSQLASNPAISFAQDGEGIWAPAPQELLNEESITAGEKSVHSSTQTPNSDTGDLSESSVDALLGRYIELQRDLYRIVLMFDEQAKVVERSQLGYEKINLKNQEIRMTTPNMPEPIAIPEQTDGAGRDDLAPVAGDPNNPAGDAGLTYFRSPVLCSELDESLRRYIQKNTAEMERVSRALAGQSVLMSDAEKAQTAEKLRVSLAAIQNLRRAEEILFLCLYKYKNEYGVPVAYSVEKTLRSWFMLQESLVDAWIGNVD